MANKVDYIDGTSKTNNEINGLIKTSTSPIVFTNLINNWPAMAWSLDEFTKLFGDIMTTFKLYHRDRSNNKKCKVETKDGFVTPVVLETDCIFTSASFKEFFEWVRQADLTDEVKSSLGELQIYPYKDFWCYADYKYMAEMFSEHPTALSAVDWSVFGYPDKNGFHSTIWIGSDEAFTPCHQDTYGTNLIAQIHGVKRWTLLPPSETCHMRPTRIPYEESSVFSHVDVKSLKTKNIFEVDLKSGEVLFVPKHWWHYVESLTPSISINIWLEHPNDSHDRVRESLVNLLVYSIKSTENVPISQWLNPTQELPPSFESCLDLVCKALEDNNFTGETQPSNLQHVFNSNFLLNCVTDVGVLDKIIDVIGRKIKSTGL